jgi:hypothetical protein
MVLAVVHVLSAARLFLASDDAQVLLLYPGRLFSKALCVFFNDARDNLSSRHCESMV